MISTLNLDISEIEQLVNKEIFISKMNVMQLKEIIKYTNRKSNENYPFQEGGGVEEEYLYYQRIKDSDRAYQIKLFFLKHIWNKYFYKTKRISPLGTFPSSIILALNSFDGISIEEYNAYLGVEEKPETVYLKREEQKIVIPKSNQALIVDGQHRIAGLELLLEEAERKEITFKKANRKDYYAKQGEVPFEYIQAEIKKFNFIISFLIDFDLYEQSEIFATVNFNQQRVNKSFYYDIFGTANTGKTIEKLLHDVASHLNYKEDSPLFHKIKMLGTGQGYFSQAFFVDALIPHFKNGGFQFVYNDYQYGGAVFNKVPDFRKAYFRGIFILFDRFLPSAPGVAYKSNLLKTTGMGALILLLPKIFNYIKNKNMVSTSKEVLSLPSNEIIQVVENIFQEIVVKGEEFFGETGNYSKGSGKGLQNKLFQDINNNLGLDSKEELAVEPVV